MAKDTSFIEVYDLSYQEMHEFLFTIKSKQNSLAYEYYVLKRNSNNQPVIERANEIIKSYINRGSVEGINIEITPVTQQDDLYNTFISAYAMAKKLLADQIRRNSQIRQELLQEYDSYSLSLKPKKQ
ncbi:MAG: hypothetical protein ACI4WW_08235 [Candidatus Coprovivens sp.]